MAEEAGAKVILTRPDDKFYSYYRSAYGSYILNNGLSELNKRKDAVLEDAKQARWIIRLRRLSRRGDISSYTAELEAKNYLSQLETQKNELDRGQPQHGTTTKTKKWPIMKSTLSTSPGG